MFGVGGLSCSVYVPLHVFVFVCVCCCLRFLVGTVMCAFDVCFFCCWFVCACPCFVCYAIGVVLCFRFFKTVYVFLCSFCLCGMPAFAYYVLVSLVCFCFVFVPLHVFYLLVFVFFCDVLLMI